MVSKTESHAVAHDDGHVHVHIASAKFYWTVFACLICLTITTVAVSRFDFGNANVVVALVIATMKASLVAAFFMHLTHDRVFNTISFLCAFLFLALFLFMTYDDLGKRADVDDDYGSKVLPDNGEVAPGGMPIPASSSSAAPAAGAGAPKHE